MINARIACAALGVPPCAVSDNQLSWHVQEEGVSRQMRRLGDIVIACLLLAITSPLMLVVALAIKLESAGPFLDRQNCIGYSGRRFQALKFRTTAYDPKLATTAWAQKTTQVAELPQYTPN